MALPINSYGNSWGNKKKILLLVFILVSNISAAEGAGLEKSHSTGMVEVFVTDPFSSRPILPDSLFKIQDKKLIVSATPGEFESGTFTLQSKNRDLFGLQVFIKSLKSDKGNFPLDHVEFKIVKAWYQQEGAWDTVNVKSKKAKLVPELLLNDEKLIFVDNSIRKNYVRLGSGNTEKYVNISSTDDITEEIVSPSVAEFQIEDADSIQNFDLYSGKNKQIWLTLKVPEDIYPGEYKGNIIVLDENYEIASIPLEIKIYPFKLEKSPIFHSLYYRGKLDAENVGSISSEHKTEIQLTAELKDMLNHGVTSPTLYQGLENPDLLRKHLKIRRDVGIDQKNLYYLGFSTGNSTDPKELSELRKKIRGVKKIAQEEGIYSVYYYGIDEAKGEKLFSQKKAWEIVHDEGGLIYVAGELDKIGDMKEYLDLLIVHTVLDRTEARTYHKNKKKLASYSNPQVGVENPAVYRKNYGFLLWQNEYDGAMTYAYQHSFGNIWNDFDSNKYRDLAFTYPTRNGVIGTLAWEGFREGRDDLRYLATLIRYINKSEKDPVYKTKPFIMNAKEYVAEIKEKKIENPAAIRKNIISHILNICCIDHKYN